MASRVNPAGAQLPVGDKAVLGPGKRELGGAEFHRLRVGVGRPDSTDPEIVSAHVLGRFSEPKADVAELVDRAATETERLITAPQ